MLLGTLAEKIKHRLPNTTVNICLTHPDWREEVFAIDDIENERSQIFLLVNVAKQYGIEEDWSRT